MMTRSVVILLLLGSQLARVPAAWAIPPAPPLKAWTDPFYEGLNTRLNLRDREDMSSTERAARLNATYGWDNGIALTLEVPAIVAQSDAGTAAVPRIGGNFTNHIETGGAFRFWGDTYDYFAAGLGVGLPIASDDASRSNISTMFLMSVYGQLDWGWGAFRFKFVDNSTLPSVNLNLTGQNLFNDSSNFIQYTLTLLLFPWDRYGPYLTWVESAPRETNNGKEFGSGAFDILTTRFTTDRTRLLGLGVQLAPFPTQTVVSLEVDKFTGWGADVANTPDWQVQGSVQWAF